MYVCLLLTEQFFPIKTNFRAQTHKRCRKQIAFTQNKWPRFCTQWSIIGRFHSLNGNNFYNFFPPYYTSTNIFDTHPNLTRTLSQHNKWTFWVGRSEEKKEYIQNETYTNIGWGERKMCTKRSQSTIGALVDIHTHKHTSAGKWQQQHFVQILVHSKIASGHFYRIQYD